MKIDNLIMLHDGEETLRRQSIDQIAQSDDASHHLLMTQSSMNLIYSFLQPGDIIDQDELAVKMLGIRLFNSLASSIKLLLAGYYQSAAALLRDVIETAFLLDYFTSDHQLIAVWRTAPDKDRRRQFGPAAVRKHLDLRDGFTAGKRGKAYDNFCRLASHPNPDSISMLVPTGQTKAHCGPFFDARGLLALLAETALSAVQGAQMFRLLVKSSTLQQIEAKLHFMEAEASWSEKFFGQKRDVPALVEMRKLLNDAKARLHSTSWQK